MRSHSTTAADNPPRQTAWNTYTPWLFALWGALSLVLIAVVAISWLPQPEIPGVPPDAHSAPLLPGGLGILMFVLAGRQWYLRTQPKNGTLTATGAQL